MELKDIIFQKRKEKGMTQEELAEKLNVARQTISKWETGETVPDVKGLKKLAVLLEFSVDEALGVEVEDNDDKIEWLIIGVFIIGNALGLIFDNLILGSAFALIGLGLWFIIKVFKR
ncbi:MAG: helix-turn-helix transcriptional regulator [bacterium]|nr:helix-turn-helix transcriptional regulator [bacterium]